MAVDACLLAGLYILALRSHRFFPIWMTGFQLVAVVSHCATMIAPDFTPKIYRALEGLWAVPITLAMIVGIATDSRARRSFTDTRVTPLPP